ncbi:MAG: hypothetical protein HYX92_20175 [Chloroflexi bacterium]|nr:hypothetical protein [Chloroflexota bacterium]
MPRKKRPDRRKRALIAAAAYIAYGGRRASRPRRRAGFSGWSRSAKLGYWGLIEEPRGK